jgi:hypothetical protein
MILSPGEGLGASDYSPSHTDEQQETAEGEDDKA